MIVSDKDLAALAAPIDRDGESPKDSSLQPRTGALLEVEFEALAYMLRDGVWALTRSKVIERLVRTSEDQVQQIIRRLTRRSTSNATPWKPHEIRALIKGRQALDA